MGVGNLLAVLGRVKGKLISFAKKEKGKWEAY